MSRSQRVVPLLNVAEQDRVDFVTVVAYCHEEPFGRKLFGGRDGGGFFPL